VKPSPFFIPCLRFVGLAFVLGGSLMALLSGSRLRAGWDSGRWPSVNGYITQSQVLPVKNSSGQPSFYKVAVRYAYSPPSPDRYQYAFEGSRLSFWGFVDPIDDSYTLKEAQALSSYYPVGRPVAVYYSPKDSQTSVLQAGTSFGTWGGIIAGLTAAVLGAGLFVVAGRARAKETSRQPSPSD